ncbi:MAG: hypothetical protein JWO53_1147 [Chlamydiia bacterium]|nr:hypothetical protein [Chlamydiia bacterium]
MQTVRAVSSPLLDQKEPLQLKAGPLSLSDRVDAISGPLINGNMMLFEAPDHFFKNKGIISSSSMSDAVLSAKKKEREAVSQALSQAVQHELEDLHLESIEDLGALLHEHVPHKTNEEQIERELCRIEARQGALTPEEKERLKRELSQRFVFTGNFSQSYTTLVDHIVAVATFAQERKNKEFLYEIRQAFANPAYEWIKHDEKCVAIHFLHAMALASYAEPRVLQAFSELGEHLGFVTAEDARPTELHGFLRKARVSGHKYGLIKNDLTISYAWKFFPNAWGSFLSIKWGKWLTSVCGCKKYDPRRDLENNAGAFFEESFQVGENSAKVAARTVYTPTPTVGDEVSLEARAILQAMENRKFMSREQLKEERYPYVKWAFVNLQNINSKDEGPRALAIMQLNEEFPLSFEGITVSVDSKFYRAGVHGRDEAKIEAAVTDDSPLNAEYKEVVRKELVQEAHFRLNNRIQAADGGYYFPDIAWKSVINKIIDKAYEAVIHHQLPLGTDQKVWNWQQKAALRELVILGIMRYLVARSVQEASALQADAKILSSYVCKECMDRGGKVNASFLWALGADIPETHKLVFSALHGRALLSRNRLVLADRVEPMLATAMVITQPEMQMFLHDIAKSVDVHSQIVTPLI